jgi:FKBP-type peptidyl-prolyl cis-trans isomerase FklB
MRYIFLPVLLVSLFFATSFAAARPELKDQTDKESYSMGYQFGQNLKSQGVAIQLDVYTSGIRDALGGAKPLLSQEEMNKAITEIQRRVAVARQKELQELAAKNLAESKAFLEANAKKEGVKTLPSGLQYKVLAEGSGKTPKPTDAVTVNYRGALINGTEFDSSYKRGAPAALQLDRVIRGWSEALPLMKEGAKWQLFIAPELAYGDRGVGSIPPNSTLIFDVELISVNETGK